MEEDKKDRIEELLVGIYNNTYSTKINVQVFLYASLIGGGLYALFTFLNN